MDAEFVTRYVYKCSEMVLRHGADASYVGRYRDSRSDEETGKRGSVLHALCEASPHLGRVDNSLLLLLLRHGADPDACVDGRYPLTSYFDALCRRSGNEDATTTTTRRESESPSSQVAETQNRSTQNSAASQSRHSQQLGVTFSVASVSNAPDAAAVTTNADSELGVTDVRRMCRMLGFMSLSAQSRCSEILRSRLTSRRPSSDVSAGLRRGLREIEKYTLAVPSLHRSCSLVVWRHCRRHVGNVYKLPVPMRLINAILDSL